MTMTAIFIWLIGWGITEGITGITGIKTGFFWPIMLGKWIRETRAQK